MDERDKPASLSEYDGYVRVLLDLLQGPASVENVKRMLSEIAASRNRPPRVLERIAPAADSLVRLSLSWA